MSPIGDTETRLVERGRLSRVIVCSHACTSPTSWGSRFEPSIAHPSTWLVSTVLGEQCAEGGDDWYGASAAPRLRISELAAGVHAGLDADEPGVEVDCIPPQCPQLAAA